jgi:hypothetical protein
MAVDEFEPGILEQDRICSTWHEHVNKFHASLLMNV